MSAFDPKRTLSSWRVATHGSNQTFLPTFAAALSLMSKFLSRESEFFPISHVRKSQMTQSGNSPSSIKLLRIAKTERVLWAALTNFSLTEKLMSIRIHDHLRGQRRTPAVGAIASSYRSHRSVRDAGAARCS